MLCYLPLCYLLSVFRKVYPSDCSATPVEEYTEWARKRAELMDAEAGLPEHCVALLKISVQRGYEVCAFAAL